MDLVARSDSARPKNDARRVTFRPLVLWGFGVTPGDRHYITPHPPSTNPLFGYRWLTESMTRHNAVTRGFPEKTITRIDREGSPGQEYHGDHER